MCQVVSIRGILHYLSNPNALITFLWEFEVSQYVDKFLFSVQTKDLDPLSIRPTAAWLAG